MAPWAPWAPRQGGVCKMWRKILRKQETLTAIGLDLGVDGPGSGALAPDGVMVGVTAKGRDVLLDPAKGLALIVISKVSHTCILGLLPGNEAKHAQTVVQTDSNDGSSHLDAVLHDEGQVVSLVGRAAHVEAAAVDPRQDGQVGVGRNARRPDDIKEQAVLSQLVANIVAAISHTGRGVGSGLLCSVPGRVQRLGLGEAGGRLCCSCLPVRNTMAATPEVASLT